MSNITFDFAVLLDLSTGDDVEATRSMDDSDEYADDGSNGGISLTCEVL